MGDSNKLSISDDEEDLEALRLAALQSLKKKNLISNGAPQAHNSAHLHLDKPVRYNRPMKGMHKRGRFFGSHQVHNGKKGPFNRVRNMNLISIPTIPTEENIPDSKPNDRELILNLPQDRYCSIDKKEVKTEEGTSKFNRYDNSDKSETESEEEEEVSSEDASPAKLERTDSLEALMQELDDEIQGKTKAKEEKPPKEEKPKIKKTKKKKRMSTETTVNSDSDLKVTNQKLDKVECEIKVEVINHNETSENKSEAKSVLDVKQTEEKKVEVPPEEKKGILADPYSPARKRPRSKSPVNRRTFQNRRRQRNFRKTPRLLPSIPFPPPPIQYSGPVIPFPNQPFNPLFAPPNIGMLSQPPPFFERPISPLAINTESLTTATLAPLSPRSAAFVLENKAIIERRKRSPRRSYSRSPSRSPRRSLTPRRSPRRSMSPRRIPRSPRRLSRSPRRRSSSPRRRSVSPRRKTFDRGIDNSPKSKQPVRERLGLKPNKTEENKDKTEAEMITKKDEKPLDPILEARKRKFETNEIKMKEGIIRLKPKEDKPQENLVPVPPPAIETEVKPKVTKPVPMTVSEDKSSSVKQEIETEPDEFKELENLLKEDILLGSDDIELDPKVDDLFSDEDSASDNEGRFKVKQRAGEKPHVLPFTTLLNGLSKKTKSEALHNADKKSAYDRRRDRHTSTKYDKKRSRGRSPGVRKDVKANIKEEGDKKSTIKKLESQEKSPVKNRISLKSDRHVTPLDRRTERKIEIKIKNPSKYERGGKLKFSKDSGDKTPDKVSRKVEVGNKELLEEGENEPEIVVENDSGDEENSVMNEGDLRAQLSKKRAEKLHRIPVEGISSRLLQNALQGAVFKKTKTKVKDQDITSSDGKLPIHLRLGIANSSDIFTDTKLKRKTRKRKNREVLEQV